MTQFFCVGFYVGSLPDVARAATITDTVTKLTKSVTLKS